MMAMGIEALGQGCSTQGCTEVRAPRPYFHGLGLVTDLGAFGFGLKSDSLPICAYDALHGAIVFLCRSDTV